MPVDMSDLAWVKSLPDHALEQILDVMHDSLGAKLRSAISDVQWDRHANPLTEWPVFHVHLGTRYSDKFVEIMHYCGRSLFEYPKADDPRRASAEALEKSPTIDHRPTRRREDLIECSCGWREGLSMGSYRRWRMGRWFWPTVTSWEGKPLEGVLGNGQRVPYYVMCKDAETVEDQRHAPTEICARTSDDGAVDVIVKSCICGRRTYEWDEPLDNLRLAPAV